MSDSTIIEDGKVVIMHYTLTDDAGEVLDSSVDDEPMPYLHGADNIVPGLERALSGKSVGEKLKVTVAPEDAYGESSGAKDQRVPRDSFPEDMEVEDGMQFFTEGPAGVVPVWVTRSTPDAVYITLDHPLAGKTLHFEVEVIGVRDANEEELDHGHPHGISGDEGHHH